MNTNDNLGEIKTFSKHSNPINPGVGPVEDWEEYSKFNRKRIAEMLEKVKEELQSEGSLLFRVY